jgi:hypothetical protein
MQSSLPTGTTITLNGVEYPVVVAPSSSLSGNLQNLVANTALQLGNLKFAVPNESTITTSALSPQTLSPCSSTIGNIPPELPSPSKPSAISHDDSSSAHGSERNGPLATWSSVPISSHDSPKGNGLSSFSSSTNRPVQLSSAQMQAINMQRGTRFLLQNSFSSPQLPVSSTQFDAPRFSCWERNNIDTSSASTASCSESECDFSHSQRKNALMMKLYGMVSNAGVDTKWIVHLLKQIGISNIDISELAQFMETQVELSESKMYDERMQKIGDIHDDDS